MQANPLLLLLLRPTLFTLFQFLCAGILQLIGDNRPSFAYWILSGVGANAVCFLLMYRSAYRSISFNKETWKKDVLIMLAFLLLAGPISMLPGQWLASTLFSNSATPMELFFYPVSTVILIIGVFWGITQGVVELPYYFSHVHSQLKQRNYARWKIIFALSFGLAFQHVALPFIPDLNFMLWRFGMFLPLAVTLALGLTWRPQLLPYLMIIHGIMDIATVGSYLSFQ